MVQYVQSQSPAHSSPAHQLRGSLPSAAAKEPDSRSMQLFERNPQNSKIKMSPKTPHNPSLTSGPTTKSICISPPPRWGSLDLDEKCGSPSFFFLRPPPCARSSSLWALGSSSSVWAELYRELQIRLGTNALEHMPEKMLERTPDTSR